MTILNRNDLNINLKNFLPLSDDDEGYNEEKISQDLDMTDREIYAYLRRAGITTPVSDLEMIADLKPIALDIICYRLTNRPNEDTELFLTRKKDAMKTLENLVTGWIDLSEKSKNVAIKTVKLLR